MRISARTMPPIRPTMNEVTVYSKVLPRPTRITSGNMGPIAAKLNTDVPSVSQSMASSTAATTATKTAAWMAREI